MDPWVIMNKTRPFILLDHTMTVHVVPMKASTDPDDDIWYALEFRLLSSEEYKRDEHDRVLNDIDVEEVEDEQ